MTSDRDIDREIEAGARTVDDIGRSCGAGTGCGRCREMIHDKLEAAGGDCRGCHDCPLKVNAA